MIAYEQLVLRNSGYIGPELQMKIRRTRLLVAGCGLGSVAAEIAVRTGFENFTLVDGDTVDAHNLNRQLYRDADVGQPKVQALAGRLQSVHPGVEAKWLHGWLKADNVAGLVAGADLVLDTIDFLDLPAIIALHDEARGQGKTVISSFSAGWGAVVVVFTPSSATLRDIGGLPATGSVDGASYPAVFGALLGRLAGRLPGDFVEVTRHALKEMADGKPCPAPQLGAGAHVAGAMMITLAVRLLAGQPVAVAPDVILVNMGALAERGGLQVPGSGI